jgi:hypothetical protein
MSYHSPSCPSKAESTTCEQHNQQVLYSVQLPLSTRHTSSQLLAKPFLQIFFLLYDGGSACTPPQSVPGLQLARCGTGTTHLQLQQVCGLSPELLLGLAARRPRLLVSDSDLQSIIVGAQQQQQQHNNRLAETARTCTTSKPVCRHSF